MLLEFPPVIGGKRLYLLNDSGRLISIHKHTGRRRWSKLGALPRLARVRRRHGLRRPAPAVEGGSGADGGRVVALDGKTGGSTGAASSPAAASPRR